MEIIFENIIHKENFENLITSNFLIPDAYANTSQRISWYEANETCVYYNANLPSFSSSDDVLAVQTILMATFKEHIISHIYIGLQKSNTVSVFVNIYCTDIFFTKLRWSSGHNFYQKI